MKNILVTGRQHILRPWPARHPEALRAGGNVQIGGGNQPTNLSIVETICDLLDEFVPGGVHLTGI
jgi:hypothetical protein